MNQKLFDLNLKMKSIAIFRNLLVQPIFIRLQQLISESQEKDFSALVDLYASFVNEIYKQGGNLTSIIFNLVIEDENAYVSLCAKKKIPANYMKEALLRELKTLEEISKVKANDFFFYEEQYKDLFPSYETSEIDFIKEYENRIQSIETCGYGIYAKHHMFVVLEDKIVPIKYPDTQRIKDFTEYERERNLLIKNTEVLLHGGTASNALLYGDAGTGKSSTIKAIVNEYKNEGLRLIEIKKQQLYILPFILEELSNNPLKFIVFIDDLSFTSNDENFAALKSILEGGVASTGNNVVIYATSNRRHLIKEDHQSRMGDEIHLNDTLQETMSLSARFGLTITFNRPEKDVYLHIVSSLAKKYGIDIEEETLFKRAEAFAIRNHGRSPRCAKQFIELLKAGF